MSDSDSLQRFMFEDLGIRGELVQLDASWQAVLARHAYPGSVRGQLGQALAAVALLSATIKFQGSLILQVQGSGPLTTLVAQATQQRTVRGLAHWQGEVPDGDLRSTFGDSRLVLTIQNQGAEPYQGIVAMEGAKLADALRVYFEQSEQLRTRLWLCADGRRAVGLLLQELPVPHRDADAWERLNLLADTASEEELLELPAQTLLYRLFNEENVRLFAAESVAFRCGCSRERIETVLRGLGREETQALLAEQGQIQVDCEFCKQHYAFDAVDVERLLREEAPTIVSATRH